MNNLSESKKIALVSSLRGCSAVVLLALWIFGRTMDNKDLRLVTGYSDKPITEALRKLTLHGMVVDKGKEGWVLSDGMKQLPLFPEALLDPRKPPRIIDAERSDDRKVSDHRPSSSSVYSNTHLFNGPEEEETSSRSRRNSEPVDNPGDNSEIINWLTRAKIGRNSPKMREILATRPALPYIQAHVLYWEFWQQERERTRAEAVDGRTRYTTGTLITRLLDGDQAPPMRCQDCLYLLSDCYCGIVQR